MAENKPNYAVDLIPKELLENAHTVVRMEDYKIEIPSYDKIVETYKSVITILKEESNSDYFSLDYNSFSKINAIKGSVYDAEGNFIREVKKKKFNDRSAVSGSTMYADDRYKWIKLNYPTYPYTIEIEYKKTTNRFMYYPGWIIQNYGAAVEKASFTVITTDPDNLKYKVLNTDIVPTKQLQGNQLTLNWEVKQQPAISRVSYSVSSNEILPRILLTASQFKLGKHKGSMNTWKEFGDFMNRLNEGRDVLSPKMKKEVLALTASVKSDREKIDVLYKYLQENTRYISVQIGVGGWQTFDADYVEKNKYGDCKALTNFMKAMLNAVEVTAYPVYIGSGRDDGLITEDFVFPSFNHVILNVPSEDYWLECTSSYSPPNYIGDGNDDRMALRVTEEGGELVKTPAFSPGESKETNKATITLSGNGDAHIINQCILIGPEQGSMRYYFYEKTQAELEKKFTADCGLSSMIINKYEVKPLLEKAIVEVNYSIEVAKYASKGGKRFFVPLNALNCFSSVPDKAVRKEKIEFKRGYMMDDEFTIVLPEGYKVESMPEESTLLESKFGTYAMKLIVDGSTLHYKRTLKILPLSLPASEYEAFRNFRMEVAFLDNAKLVLVKKQT